MWSGNSACFQSLDLERFLRTKWRKAFPSHLQLSSGPKHHTKPQEEQSQPPSAPWGLSPAPEMPESPCTTLEEPWPEECSPSLDLQGHELLVPPKPTTWCPQHPKLLYLGVLLERFTSPLSLETLSETWHKYLTSTRSETLMLRESLLSVCYLLSLCEKEEHWHLLLRAIIVVSMGGCSENKNINGSS